MRFLFHLNSLNGKIAEILKDKRKLTALIIAILGILMIILSFGSKGSTEAEEYSLDKYKAELEDELESLCESIDGVGKCRVTVTFSEGERIEYKGSNVTGSEPPRVLGVTVVCEGGDAADVKSEISECMKALFNIGSNRVCVLKMK